MIKFQVFFGGFAVCLLISFQALCDSAGRLVFMVETADGQKQVAMVEPGQKTYSLLTHGPKWHLYPRISADGNHVVYSEGKDGQNLGLYILNLKDKTVEQWTSENGQNLHGRFSGDGKFLAYSGSLGPNRMAQIALIDLVSERKNPLAL